MTTKYYVDVNGNYIGAFDGEHGMDLTAYVEVSSAPVKKLYHSIYMLH